MLWQGKEMEISYAVCGGMGDFGGAGLIDSATL